MRRPCRGSIPGRTEFQCRLRADDRQERRPPRGLRRPDRGAGPSAARGRDRRPQGRGREVEVADVFMTAASAGACAGVQTNTHYTSHKAYVKGCARNAGIQGDRGTRCPDLAMARHTSFRALSEAKLIKRAAFHVEVLNHALRNVPANMCRIHICWGRGRHDHDIDFRRICWSRPSRWRSSSRPTTRGGGGGRAGATNPSIPRILTPRPITSSTPSGSPNGCAGFRQVGRHEQ